MRAVAAFARWNADDRAPLLIVGAAEDHTVPASVSRAQHKKYQRSTARTDYLEFEGRPHLFVLGEGWEEVADYAIDWALEAATAKVAA